MGFKGVGHSGGGGIHHEKTVLVNLLISFLSVSVCSCHGHVMKAIFVAYVVNNK